MQKSSSPQDAISLLVADHKTVAAMFKKYEGLGDRAYVAKKSLSDEICTALIEHTTIEEEIFYPAVRNALPGEADDLDEAAVEHAAAKDLIAQIQEMDASEDLFDAKVKVLSEQIEHHVGEEETEMFPKVRKSGKLDLEDLGQQMAERKQELHAQLA